MIWRHRRGLISHRVATAPATGSTGKPPDRSGVYLYDMRLFICRQMVCRDPGIGERLRIRFPWAAPYSPELVRVGKGHTENLLSNVRRLTRAA